MRKTIQFLQLAFLLLLATACAETSPFKYESDCSGRERNRKEGKKKTT